MTTKDTDIFEKELESRIKLCGIIADKDAAYDALAAECAALRKDAERWRHADLHGFPVRNQTSTTGKAWREYAK